MVPAVTSGNARSNGRQCADKSPGLDDCSRLAQIDLRTKGLLRPVNAAVNKSRKTTIGPELLTGQKVGHGCPVLLKRLLRKPAHLGKEVAIAATQQAQRVSPLNGSQASCSGQEAGEERPCRDTRRHLGREQ